MNNPIVMIHKPSESIFVFVPASYNHSNTIFLTFKPNNGKEVLLTVLQTSGQDPYFTRLRFPFKEVDADADADADLFVLYELNDDGALVEVKKYRPASKLEPEFYRGILLLQASVQYHNSGETRCLAPVAVRSGKNLDEFQENCLQSAKKRKGSDILLGYAMACKESEDGYELLGDAKLVFPDKGFGEYDLEVDIRVGEDEQFTTGQSASVLQTVLMSEPKPVLNVSCVLSKKPKDVMPTKLRHDVSGRLGVYYISIKRARLKSLIKTQLSSPNESLEFLFGLIRPNSSAAPFPIVKDEIVYQELCPNSERAEFEVFDPCLGDFIVIVFDSNIVKNCKIKLEGVSGLSEIIPDKQTASFSWHVFLRSGAAPLDKSDLAALEDETDKQYGLAYYRNLMTEKSEAIFTTKRPDYREAVVHDQINTARLDPLVEKAWEIAKDSNYFGEFGPLFLSSVFWVKDRLELDHHNYNHDVDVEIMIESQSLLDSKIMTPDNFEKLNSRQLYSIKSDYELLKKIEHTRASHDISDVAEKDINEQVKWFLSNYPR